MSTEFEPSAPLPERPKWVDVFGSIPDHPLTDDDAHRAEVKWLRAEVESWKMLARFARERAERAEADLAAERETRQRVEAYLERAEQGADALGTCHQEWLRIDDLRRALSPDAEPERCPHVAEPGSRHEDEDCPCVEGGA